MSTTLGVKVQISERYAGWGSLRYVSTKYKYVLCLNKDREIKKNTNVYSLMEYATN